MPLGRVVRLDSAVEVRCAAAAGGVESDGGTTSDGFGVNPGSANGAAGTTANVSARAVPATAATKRSTASDAKRRIEPA